MGLFSKLTGTSAPAFQIGGPNNPLINEPGDGSLETKNSANSAYANHRGADPVVAQDFVTKNYLDTNTMTDGLLFFDTFNSQNSSSSDYNKWRYTTAGGGTLTWNGLDIGAILVSAGDTVSASAAGMQSIPTFRCLESYALFFTTTIELVAAPVNSFMLFGFGSGNTPFNVPVDGVYFGISNGTITANARYRGELLYSIAMPTQPASLPFYGRFTIQVTDKAAVFTVYNLSDGTVLSTLTIQPAGTVTTSGPKAMAFHAPVFFGIRNTGTTSAVAQFQFSNTTVSQQGIAADRSHAEMMAQAGYSANIDQLTFAQSANYANNTAPAAATLSNTAASYTTLGGLFQFVVVAGAETDYALFAYQVPVESSAVGGLSGKNLIVYSVKIDAFITGAASLVSPTLLQWAIGLNSSSASLAIGGNTPPIITPIGMQSASATAAIDSNFTPGPVLWQPNTPMVVRPSRFFHVILRIPTGNATAGQSIRGFVAVDAIFDT